MNEALQLSKTILCSGKKKSICQCVYLKQEISTSREVRDLFHRKCQYVAFIRPDFKYVTLSSTPKSWYFPTPLVPFTFLEPLMEFSWNTKRNGTGLSEWDLCLQCECLLPDHLICTHSLMRSTVYGGRKETGESRLRNFSLDFHGSIIREHEALFLTICIWSELRESLKHSLCPA